MGGMSDDAIRKVGELLLGLRGPIAFAQLCPACGSEMKIRDSMHCSGRDEQGRCWTCGVDWAFCEPCRQWFQMVHGPKHPPPRPWEPCQPPSVFANHEGADPDVSDVTIKDKASGDNSLTSGYRRNDEG
jgi:hypothetical protein